MSPYALARNTRQTGNHLNSEIRVEDDGVFGVAVEGDEGEEGDDDSDVWWLSRLLVDQCGVVTEDGGSKHRLCGGEHRRLAKDIMDFGNGIITIHPDFDLFFDDSDTVRDNEENRELMFDLDEIEETELPPLNCKMGKSSRNKKRVLESFQICYPNEGPSRSKGEPMTQEEAHREKLLLPKSINMDIDVEKVKKSEQRNSHEKPLHYKPMGLLKDALCQVGVATIIANGVLDIIDQVMSTYDGVCHQTFRAARTNINTLESDSDDKEEYAVKRDKFGAPTYGLKSAK
ncbi:hypothetical protein Tco_0167458 [Tanacetum coccineum]